MREINVQQITDVVEKLCIEANQYLPEDVQCAIKGCRSCEDWEIGVYWTISLRILRLQRRSMCQSVRIQVWLVCSLRLARMCI